VLYQCLSSPGKTEDSLAIARDADEMVFFEFAAAGKSLSTDLQSGPTGLSGDAGADRTLFNGS